MESRLRYPILDLIVVFYTILWYSIATLSSSLTSLSPGIVYISSIFVALLAPAIIGKLYFLIGNLSTIDTKDHSNIQGLILLSQIWFYTPPLQG